VISLAPAALARAPASVHPGAATSILHLPSPDKLYDKHQLYKLALQRKYSLAFCAAATSDGPQSITSNGGYQDRAAAPLNSVISFPLLSLFV